MNSHVSKATAVVKSKKRSKSLAEIRNELTELSIDHQLTLIGGVVFRIRRKKKLCGNIVPQ